jgi:hypothetical protein
MLEISGCQVWTFGQEERAQNGLVECSDYSHRDAATIPLTTTGAASLWGLNNACFSGKADKSTAIRKNPKAVSEQAGNREIGKTGETVTISGTIDDVRKLHGRSTSGRQRRNRAGGCQEGD